MSPYHKKQKEKRRKNLFRKWHRRVGFSAAIFLLNLAITGILLNHSDSLELHKSYVKSDWIANWYGISAPDKAQCFTPAEKGIKICQLGEKWFVDQQLLAHQASDLVGVIYFDSLFYIASSESLSIYTQDWSLVEVIESQSGLPIPIKTLRVAEIEHSKNATKQSLVITSNGKSFAFDEDTLAWAELPNSLSKQSSNNLINTIVIDEIHLQTLKAEYLDHQISYLKLVQDLHSGRLLNGFGRWVTDLVAIIIILLALSGFFAWQKRTNNIN
jgi:hypothetical protein